MTLPKFQFAGRHVLNIVSSVYLAAIVANAVGKFVPSVRLATFVILSVSLILSTLRSSCGSFRVAANRWP